MPKIMKNILALLLPFIVVKGFSQEYISSMYSEGYAQLNPAVFGFYDKLEANSQYGFSDGSYTPHFLSAIVGFRLGELNGGHGFGVSYGANHYTEYAQRVTKESIMGSYNYQFQIKNDHKFSLGASFGKARAESKGGFPFLQERWTTSFGVLYNYKKFDTGISISHFGADPTVIEQQIWLFSSYKFELNDEWIVKPQLLLRARDFNVNHIDALHFYTNLSALYQDKYWFGLAVNNYDTRFSLQTGLILAEKYHIAYAFGYDSFPLDQYSHPVHEFSLSFKIK